MKRIIRLTESDLSRIVRRVINEDTETTTMTPKEYSQIETSRGALSMEANIAVDNVRSFQDVTFVGLATKRRKTDEKGNRIETKDVGVRFTGKINGKLIQNFYLAGVFECNGTRVSTDNYFTTDNNILKDATEVTFNFGTSSFTKNPIDTIKSLNSYNPVLKYAGATKELVDFACKTAM